MAQQFPSDSVQAAAAGSPDGTLVGRNADGKVAFFGAVPILQPTIPATGGTVQNVIDALAALNLVRKV